MKPLTQKARRAGQNFNAEAAATAVSLSPKKVCLSRVIQSHKFPLKSQLMQSLLPGGSSWSLVHVHNSSLSRLRDQSSQL